MSRHLEIIKGFALFLSILLLISAVAISDSAYTVNVEVKQSSSTDDEDEAVTVVNTYTQEGDSPGKSKVDVISGSGSSTITNEDDDETPAGSEDSGADDNPYTGIRAPNFEIGELTYEEYNEILLDWIYSTLTEEPLATTDDLLQDEVDIAGVG